MKSVVLADPAKEDLSAIKAWYSENASQTTTARTLKAIRDKLKFLKRHSGMGRPRPEIASECRSIMAGEHTIFYVEDDREVQILRIIHHCRDIRKAMFQS